MKRISRALAVLALVLVPHAGWAACYADYKAKKDGPLRLHYGVVKLPDNACGDRSAAQRYIAERIERDGWTLLTVVSVFEESGLGQREESAGSYFLRY